MSFINLSDGHAPSEHHAELELLVHHHQHIVKALLLARVKDCPEWEFLVQEDRRGAESDSFEHVCATSDAALEENFNVRMRALQRSSDVG